VSASDLGKKLYKSTALKQFKAVYLGIAIFLLGNLLLQTLGDPTFKAEFEQTFSGVVAFHLRYPEDFFLYLVTIFIPSIYYSFIRGIVFCENGLIINRGFPFFNRSVLYQNICAYRVIHRKYLMGVKRSDIDEEFVFTIRDIDRVIAIFDQHNIEGELGKESLKKKSPLGKRVIITFVLFGAAMAIVQYFGGLGRLLRQF